MAQVVEPDILQAGLRAQALPDLVDRHISAAGLAAGEDPGTVSSAGHSGQHRLDRRGQRHSPGAGLGILQPQFGCNVVDIVPLQAQDLVPAAAGQQQQADRRDGDGILRAVPFGLGQRPAEPAVLVARQEPFARRLLVAPHSLARVLAGRHQIPGFGQPEHRRQHRQRPVGLVGHGRQAVVQGDDMAPLDGRYRKVAQRRNNMVAHNQAEAVSGVGAAVHLDMLA